MGWKASALDVARRTGALDALGAWYGRGRITALAYHRIANVEAADLVGYRGNVSASPEAFAQQLDWLADRFTVVSLDSVLAWMEGETDLPSRPAVMTFDDGYADNLEVAAPLLAERGMPATLFLTTGPTDGGPALFWDHVAWLFAHTTRDSAVLPVVGERSWSTPQERDRVVHEMVYATKWLPSQEREIVLHGICDVLEAECAERIPGLYLDWDSVRSLEGWTIGSHTVSHPVLTSVPLDAATREIEISIRRIREETGQAVRSLAYPNGLDGDHNEAIASLAGSAGIDLAFTLQPGPARRREVRSRPMEVRRVYVGFRDSLAVFAGKAMGAARIMRQGQ